MTAKRSLMLRLETLERNRMKHQRFSFGKKNMNQSSTQIAHVSTGKLRFKNIVTKSKLLGHQRRWSVFGGWKKTMTRIKHRLHKLEIAIFAKQAPIIITANAGDLDKHNQHTPQLKKRLSKILERQDGDMNGRNLLIINTGLYRFSRGEPPSTPFTESRKPVGLAKTTKIY
jgi:hypothetical protein